MEQKFIVNIVRSPEDERDWKAESIYKATSLPKTFSLVSELQPIRHQGSQGTCAAQTAACMKEWQEKKDINFEGYMSPQFIYNNRQNQDSEGMYGRDVMKILSKIGCCSEKDYRYGLIENPKHIDSTIFKKAKNHTISNYAKVDTIQGLKNALIKNGPCYIAVPVYDHSDTMWKCKNTEDKQQGGHAMTIVGYDKKGFIIRNSWGKNWGNKGYCIFPYEDWGSQWEVWTTIDDKSFEIPQKKCLGCF